MKRRKRGHCRFCGYSFRLTKYGTVYYHGLGGCLGSGREPLEAMHRREDALARKRGEGRG